MGVSIIRIVISWQRPPVLGNYHVGFRVQESGSGLKAQQVRVWGFRVQLTC